ncbi:MAG: DJ-1/PfpI family protein [Gammaproteobacteria bacterium]|nr:DJ-1/PfpI family protein [Gammaproteobacteria bacterium]MBV9698442.1 DJ-1/PfpI family protein [Gammaproteobacteria bacterium]
MSEPRIVFPLFPGVTQLDFTGPLEVLSRLPGAQVVLASRTGGALPASGGVTFTGLVPLREVPDCQVLCVPGGFGTTEAMLDGEYLAQLRRLAGEARYVTSVCTGSLLLGAAGLLRGRRAACHWAYRELLPLFGAEPDPARVVRDGNLITGGGVTAGIDLGLTVLAELAGREFAEGVQLALEYAPEPPFASGRPEQAHSAVRARVLERIEALAPQRHAVAERVAQTLREG